MAKKKTGGVPARNGHKFSEEIEEIKIKRISLGKSKEKVSTEKISNLIVRHKNWGGIKTDIITATQEEIEENGTEE